MTANTGLVVPIDVAAYCVGIIDAQQQTVNFAGATTDYQNQLTGNPQVNIPAFLGVNVTRDPFIQPPLWSLEAGVHLHWAMPDNLVQAKNTAGDLDFPALPNRWLVTRVVISGKAAAGKSWIIQSDALSTVAPSGNNAPTLPVTDTDADSSRGFRYVGAWQILDDGWIDPAVPPGQAIKNLFGSEIHAVASGDIAFAAFYPNARNVFGFYDDLADLTQTPAALMYVVTGWFSESANDPISQGLTLAQIQAQLGWTFDDSVGTPSYSLYSGLVQDIDWDRNTQYISEDQNPIQLDVAIGNSPAEALAAYFRGRNSFDASFEQLFTLFEKGLLSQYKQPQPGQLAQLAETLHDQQFSNYHAGVVSTIVAKPPSDKDNGTDRQDIAPNLPLPLADALNLLNQYQQEADLAAVQTQQYQWQLFADWYRLFVVDQSGFIAAANSFSQRAGLWPTIQSIQDSATTDVENQTKVVAGMLGDNLLLKQVPGPRYLEPNEPVVLLAGDLINPPLRYGGDGSFDPSGFLVCRLTSQVLGSVTLEAGSVAASQFAGILPSASAQLPFGTDVNNLLEEGALLNTDLVAALTGDQAATLAGDLQAWLQQGEKAGNAYQSFSGSLPSPVAVQWWAKTNPWFPLMMIWQANFHPLMATTQDGGLQNYRPDFFINNYSLNPSKPGTITYAPGTGPGSIDIDPQSIDFDPTNSSSGTQAYHAAAVLSAKAADNLRTLLTNYLKTTQDTTLQTILNQLSTNIMMQALSGLNNGMLMREPSLQLSIGVSTSAPMPYQVMTAQALNIITDIPSVAPIFNGSFNPLRAGYMQLALQIMDTFGQKRPVTIDNLYISESLATYYRGQLEPGIVYLQPRLSQETRLLFRWLAADTTEFDEMNVHPATSPVCGWLLPDHLVEGFFFYNQQGKALGSLTLNGDGSSVVWQSTPGNDNTIDETVDTVMRFENPHLRDLAVAVSQASPDFFKAFWSAVDTAAPLSTPVNPNSQAGLATLVGRPVALVQVSLLLELHGTTAYNQSFNTLDSQQNLFVDTDNQLGTMQFPLVLGDLSQIDDGLVGYFKQNNAGVYDTSTFYSEAAPAAATSGVIQPPVTNLLLTPSSTPEGTPPSVVTAEEKVLMLMDPRAGIHATMGILPTQFLQIPPDQYIDSLTDLEVVFLAAPVLKQPADLALPLGKENGCTWSWVEETQTAKGQSEWTVTPDIEAPNANAVWQYSPQTISEGWLRLSPDVLEFSLLNSSQQPVVNGGVSNSLSLVVKNLRQSTITFTPSTIVNEGAPATGSLFYIHFGALVESANVTSIEISALGWTFQELSDAQYGSYWAATPAPQQPLSLGPGDTLTIVLNNVQVTSRASRAQIYFDYYSVAGDNDGTSIATLAIQQPASAV